MSSTSTVLITGANRGIGKALAAAYLATPNTTVVSSVRTTATGHVVGLQQLPVAQGSRLIIVPLDVGSPESITALPQTLSGQGVEFLDVVISNAGLGDMSGHLSDAERPVLEKLVAVNAYGPWQLYQVTRPFLLKSIQRPPRFCVVSSLAGNIENMDVSVPTGPYSISKAMVNVMMKRIALENADIVTWPVHPGFVASDMGMAAVENLAAGSGEAQDRYLPLLIQPDECAQYLKTMIDNASFEKTHGKYYNYDGHVLPW